MRSALVRLYFREILYSEGHQKVVTRREAMETAEYAR
jgi:hypothetical protein